MQDGKLNPNSNNNSIHSFAKNNITAYEKVVEEKAEDVVYQINEEFNVGEKALFTNPKEESEKQTNKLDMNITLPMELSKEKNALPSNSHQFSRKRRNLYIALLILFIVGIGAGLGIFFGINNTKQENMILTSKPLDGNSFFQEKIKEKAADEPILVRNFQVGESYLYKKSSKSQIYKSTNSSEKNITITESYTYYYVSEKKENGDLKIFFHLNNLTQSDEKKENQTMLIHNSFDILNQISKNASLLNEIYKVPNITFNMGYFTLCRNGSYYDFSIHEKFFEDFIFLAKSLIEEFTPILSAKIYQNKGKRMLLEHQQNSTVSGHFDGNLTEEGTLLIKTTDSQDYKKNGLGEAAQVETKQISNFDKNGTLINSTQNSKVEFNLDNPKNEDEKEYKANRTSSNSTDEKEKIYNETVRKNDTEKKYVYNSTDPDSESNKTQSSLLKNSTLDNTNATTKNSEANSSSSNPNATVNSPDSGSNGTVYNNTISSSETNTTAQVNKTSEVAETLNATNSDLNGNSNNTNGTSNRILQENKPETQKDEVKGKIIQETSDTFSLISLTIFDEFYKNISSTFLNFEYDENEKPNVEEIDNSDANNTQLSTSLYDDSDLELESENTTKTENKTKIKESSFNNKNSTENKSLDNSNNTISKNSTKKKAFVAFADYQNKYKTNATNEDPSKLPSSKNFRLLLSSSLLEDKVFRMNILSTNILGMSISFYAEGAIRVLDNKLEFGVYSTIIGLKIPLYKGSLDIKISEALKNLLMYNQNLLNQILSLTNFPFADLIKEVSSLRERILKTIDLDSIKANLLSNLKEYIPSLMQTLQAFSSELKTHVQNQLVGLKDEFSKIFSETIIAKYKNFRDTLQAEILSITKGKWDEIKNFIGEAQQIYNDIEALPQELVDKVIKFKSDLRENLEKKLKEKMLSSVDALIKEAYQGIKDNFSSVQGLSLFDLRIRQEKEEFGFIDYLNAFSESGDMVLKAIELAYAAEKEKLSVFIESEFSYLRKTIFEAADVNEVFSKLTTDMDSFVTKLRSKVKVGVTVSESLGLQKMQTLFDQKFSAIATYSSKIELKSYITIQANAVISSVNSKVSSTLSTFKTKSSILIESLTAKANEFFNKEIKRLESLEVEVTEFYSSTSQKILSINKQIEGFVSSNTDKFLNGIFTSSIKKRFLSGKYDLFSEVINAVKSFENMVDTFQPQLIGLDVAKDVHDKVTNLRNSLAKGLIFAASEIDKVLTEINALFKMEGKGLFKSFISNRVLSGLKLDFKVSNLSAISSNFNGFKDTFKSAVDKFLGFKNTFRGVIDNAKNKISSLINLDGMNFSRNILSKNLLNYKYRHPIPVLGFIIWLEAHFTTNMSMNLFSKASLFGIEVGFDFGLSASMGGSAYVDFYLVHAGVSANANLVELNNSTGAGFKFLQLAGNFKSCGSIRFLNVSVGFFIRYLRIRIAWHCWRIRIWWFRITICVPYLQFYMSDPLYLVSYNSPYAVNTNFCFWNLDF